MFSNFKIATKLRMSESVSPHDAYKQGKVSRAKNKKRRHESLPAAVRSLSLNETRFQSHQALPRRAKFSGFSSSSSLFQSPRPPLLPPLPFSALSYKISSLPQSCTCPLPNP